MSSFFSTSHRSRGTSTAGARSNRSRRSLRRASCALALVGIAMTACNGSSSPTEPSGNLFGNAALKIVSGNHQSGSSGTTLADPLVVSLTDASGLPAAGVSIAWKLVVGDGEVSGEPILRDGQATGAVSTMTDFNGEAEVYLRLGSPGLHVVSANHFISDGPIELEATAE